MDINQQKKVEEIETMQREGNLKNKIRIMNYHQSSNGVES